MDTNTISNSVVTVEEYFEILTKVDALSPKEESQKNIFKQFLSDCENNKEHISPASRDIYTEYRKEIAKLYCKKNLTEREREEINEYESKMNNSNNHTRVLSKSGYVDAIVILALLLSVGIIIAAVILGNR